MFKKYYILLVLILSSCFFNDRSDDILLARVGDSKLYYHELTIPNNLLSSDSMAFIQQYIYNWAQEELILQKAELNIDTKNLNLEKRLEDYRRSLLIHAYEQSLIQQGLDTLVTQQEMRDYHNLHKEDYILSKKIAQILFLQLSNLAPELDAIKNQVLNADTLDLNAIEEYAHLYSKRYYYNKSEWLDWSDVINVIPNTNYLQDLSLKNNTMQINDSLDVYLIRLIDVRGINEIAPLEFVQQEIKSILLNQRKLKTIDYIQSKLLEDAKQSQQFEIY